MPRSTAFLASNPAASMTVGFDVFVQLVIEAMSTLPWPICASKCGKADSGRICGESGAGCWSRISDSLGSTTGLRWP